MNDKTYNFKIPVKKSKPKEDIYISHHWFLRLLDYLDFKLPYRPWYVKVLAFPVVFLIGCIISYVVTGGEEDLSWFPFVFTFGLIFLLRKRETVSRTYFVMSIVNLARIERYVEVANL